MLKDTRYAVIGSTAPWARTHSKHRTLGEAYKSMVKVHLERHKMARFPMAQTVHVIIATVADDQIIREDIYDLNTLDGIGPQSRRRLPLPIVVHQWNPQQETYIRFGVE